jgi:hypothetical protein
MALGGLAPVSGSTAEPSSSESPVSTPSTKRCGIEVDAESTDGALVARRIEPQPRTLGAISSAAHIDSELPDPRPAAEEAHVAQPADRDRGANLDPRPVEANRASDPGAAPPPARLPWKPQRPRSAGPARQEAGAGQPPTTSGCWRTSTRSNSLGSQSRAAVSPSGSPPGQTRPRGAGHLVELKSACYGGWVGFGRFATREVPFPPCANRRLGAAGSP